MNSLLLALVGAGQAATPHPCVGSADLGPDRYDRKSMIVYPLEIAPEAVQGGAPYQGTDAGGAQLASDADLARSIVGGLFTVDFPLKRFDAWLSNAAPAAQDGQLLPGRQVTPTAMALACADAAVVPRLTSFVTEVSQGDGPPSFTVTMSMEMDVYQREGGLLVKTATLTADAPAIVDRVEDVMSKARQQSVDQLKGLMPGGGADKVDKIRDNADLVVSALPAKQSDQLANVIEQSELAVTRVASIARPATLIPLVEEAAHPGAAGIGWRGVENRCYTDPPDPEATDYAARAYECVALNRARQAVRKLQLDTRKVPGFQLYAPTDDGRGRARAMPLGDDEGLNVGDGYWLRDSGKTVGYARVKRVGAGGAEGVADPSKLQVVYMRPGNAKASLDGWEDARLGIEVAGWGGLMPATRPESALPVDPLEGGEREVTGGENTATGALRFDVNLGRMTRMFEWYQTNRVAIAMMGDLMHSASTFGVEKRFLVAPRTSLYAGAGLNFQTWSVPSGEVYTDDEGEDHEITASETRIGPEGDGGVVVMLHPAIMLRANVGYRLVKPVESFAWSHEDREGETVPVPVDGGPFELNGSGLFAGVSTAWVF